jgi:hypothetical protein
MAFSFWFDGAKVERIIDAMCQTKKKSVKNERNFPAGKSR